MVGIRRMDGKTASILGGLFGLAFIGLIWGVHTGDIKPRVDPPKAYWNGVVNASPIYTAHFLGSNDFSAALSLDTCVKTIYSDNDSQIADKLASAIKQGDNVRVAINPAYSLATQPSYRIDFNDSVWVNGKLLDF